MDTRVRVGKGGRIVLPADFRRRLDVETGQELIARLEDGEVRLFSPERAIARAQEIVRRHVPQDRSLVEALLAERRAEAEAEADGA